jgi:hypothetical protein
MLHINRIKSSKRGQRSDLTCPAMAAGVVEFGSLVHNAPVVSRRLYSCREYAAKTSTEGNLCLAGDRKRSGG